MRKHRGAVSRPGTLLHAWRRRTIVAVPDLVYFDGGRLRRASGLPVNLEAATTDPSDLADAVRDAGRWEVAVHDVPAVAVMNVAEDDWVYGWVTDP